MSHSLLGAVFGLAAAASWGVGDFCGGVAARRSQVYTVVLVSELVGLLLLTGLALLLAEPIPATGDLLWAGAAGIAGTLGLLALYRGLATGRMGVVAPIAAVVSAAVPLIFGSFLEGVPTAPQLLGFGLALVAVWLLSCTGEGVRIQGYELGLPLIAGLGFGLFLVGIDQVSDAAIFYFTP